MAFVQIYFWETRGRGHLGMALQTPSGHKTYITMLNQDAEGYFDTGTGYAPTLPEELRNWTGIQGGMDAHAQRRQARGFQLRPGQKVVTTAPVGQDKKLGKLALHGAMAPVGRRVTIRQAGSVGPSNGARMSVVLAAGQIYKEPTTIVELPALTDDQLGIDTQKIFSWWKSYAGKITMKRKIPFFDREDHEDWNFQARNRFKVLSTHLNCCGTVYLALRVGGATYFKGRSHRKLYATPAGVVEWVRQVKTAIEDLNRAATTTRARYESKRAEFERKIGRNQQRNPNDLPTLEEWKAISYVGVMARRKEQIADMDRELHVYHNLSWDNADHIEQKARALGNIMRSAEEHARLKPMSDRSHAVSYLISKAWEVLERRLLANDDEQEFRNQPRDERGMYNSLAFTDAEFHELFMGDEWIVAPDKLEYNDVDALGVHDGWFNDIRDEHRPRVVSEAVDTEEEDD